MKFTLAIYSAPQQDASDAALGFAEALTASDHELYRLFFFSEGVRNGIAADNPLIHRWQKLIREQQIDAVLCVSSAAKRDIGDAQAHRPAEGFTISGLGQL